MLSALLKDPTIETMVRGVVTNHVQTAMEKGFPAPMPTNMMVDLGTHSATESLDAIGGVIERISQSAPQPPSKFANELVVGGITLAVVSIILDELRNVIRSHAVGLISEESLAALNPEVAAIVREAQEVANALRATD